jgi:hypothetical protein
VFNEEMKPIKWVFVPPDKEEEKALAEQAKKTIAAPLIDGKRHIGSGEDAPAMS